MRGKDGFADVVEAADPGYGALDAHAEAAVGDGAVAAQIEIPLEGFHGELVLLDAALEQVVVGDTLAADDDFSEPSGASTSTHRA
jgi:hypothetical protein